MTEKIKIAPSIASADQSRLGEAIQLAQDAGADLIHFDLEDGVFLPNITFGPRTIKDLRPYSNLPFDVHIELANPEAYLPEIAEAGANVVSVHLEACPYLHRTIQFIRELGMEAGVAFNAVTPIDPIRLVLDKISVIHLMTADPDRVGQKLLPPTLLKIQQAAELCRGMDIGIEVDGGINSENISDVVKAGARIVVVGRGIWGADDPVKAIEHLRNMAEQAISN